jgi:hypothetical protein
MNYLIVMEVLKLLDSEPPLTLEDELLYSAYSSFGDYPRIPDLLILPFSASLLR